MIAKQYLSDRIYSSMRHWLIFFLKLMFSCVYVHIHIGRRIFMAFYSDSYKYIGDLFYCTKIANATHSLNNENFHSNNVCSFFRIRNETLNYSECKWICRQYKRQSCVYAKLQMAKKYFRFCCSNMNKQTLSHPQHL